MKYDVVIIGAGIVGLATAYRLSLENPKLRLCILEKEDGVARHQTGHNSGVIHSGIYYKPKSLKALNCKKGYDELLVFCREHGIRHEVCGKVIVATKKEELSQLHAIFQRGIENGLTGIQRISRAETLDIEPHVNCVEAIRVPQTGIVDFPQMCEKMAELIVASGHDLFFNQKALKIQPQTDGSNVVITEGGHFGAKLVVTCAGLYADKLTKMTNLDADFTVLPFRGEYFKLREDREYLCRHLIYPVPNPNFPFLGVHFTRMVRGGIEAGPNAVLSFRREGYSRWDFDAQEFFETLTFSGFRKIAFKYWRDGLGEMHRSYVKSAFVRALQNLMPDITAADLVEGGSGVRAMACDAAGNLVDDFWFIENANTIHVCNAPSPAATASLAIGKTVADKVLKRF
jgi:(S)-2-hydroxyglutarate dehydrogenase